MLLKFEEIRKMSFFKEYNKKYLRTPHRVNINILSVTRPRKDWMVQVEVMIEHDAYLMNFVKK